MIDIRSLLLKAGATLLTLGTSLLSAAYVTAHLKNPAAPLHPSVLNAASAAISNVNVSDSLTLTPAVQGVDQPAITSTYAS